jgi:hypothetical protein
MNPPSDDVASISDLSTVHENDNNLERKLTGYIQTVYSAINTDEHRREIDEECMIYLHFAFIDFLL